MKIEGNNFREECVNILLVSVILHHCQTKKIRPTDPNFWPFFRKQLSFFRPNQRPWDQ